MEIEILPIYVTKFIFMLNIVVYRSVKPKFVREASEKQKRRRITGSFLTCQVKLFPGR